MGSTATQTLIVVTGVGLASPLGHTLSELGCALIEGRSGARVRAQGFEAVAQVPARRARRLSRLALMTVAAGRTALGGSEAAPGCSPDRLAVVLATGFGPLEPTVAFVEGYLGGGAEATDPALFPTTVLNEPAAQVAIELGARGPNLTVTSPYQGAFAALGIAAEMLEERRADAVLVGASDELSPRLEGALSRLGLVSRAGQARPYDRRRDGIVPGEAATLLLLEREPDARQRGVRPLGIVAAATWTGDPAAAITGALAQAGRRADEMDFVCLAGNGSPTFDRAEAELLRRLGLGSHPCASLLGGAGESASSAALRFAQAIVALEHGVLAGTSGFEQPDPNASLPALRGDPVQLPSEQRPRAVLVASGPTRGGSGAAIFAAPRAD